MTDREDSSMPEKTLRKRKETKHPSLSLSSMCKYVYVCVHVCAGTMPPQELSLPGTHCFCKSYYNGV